MDDVKRIRAIMDTHRDAARLYLGGVPMIVADSIGYIRHDLIVFGAGVTLFLVIILSIAFRKPRWVVLPLLIVRPLQGAGKRRCQAGHLTRETAAIGTPVVPCH